MAPGVDELVERYRASCDAYREASIVLKIASEARRQASDKLEAVLEERSDAAAALLEVIAGEA